MSIRERLAAHGLAPSKARGQNFLRSERVARQIVELLGLEPTDAAVEIGPGLGDLTRAIAAVARSTIALEIDRGLVQLLAEAGLPASVEVRHEDALEADLGGMARALGDPVVLLGNLPYAISGRFLGNLLGPRTPFRRWGFMLQSEVAARLTAEPGSTDYGPLAVWAGLWTHARPVLELGPEAFVPRPRVRSTFLVFDPAPDGPEVVDMGVLRAVVRHSFQHRRKTLRAALRGRVPGAQEGLETTGIDPQRRGETLAEAEFVALANAIARLTPVPGRP
jgi:16S rRNA (adenine1518-N6/adenine1519-N6)-dimethyltransferase